MSRSHHIQHPTTASTATSTPNIPGIDRHISTGRQLRGRVNALAREQTPSLHGTFTLGVAGARPGARLSDNLGPAHITGPRREQTAPQPTVRTDRDIVETADTTAPNDRVSGGGAR